MSEGYDASGWRVARSGRHGLSRGGGTVSGVELEAEPLSFTCPRCSSVVTARLYGPCGSCRDELRAKYVIEGRVIELADYEPKMNVTPNAVALKDD
jgi:hypothetical protein